MSWSKFRDSTGGSFQIYPYWNVNSETDSNKWRAPLFQIYPYWNVNIKRISKDLYADELSNLSILECKSAISSSERMEVEIFQIYPYWNVNLII